MRISRLKYYSISVQHFNFFALTFGYDYSLHFTTFVQVFARPVNRSTFANAVSHKKNFASKMLNYSIPLSNFPLLTHHCLFPECWIELGM